MMRVGRRGNGSRQSLRCPLPPCVCALRGVVDAILGVVAVNAEGTVGDDAGAAGRPAHVPVALLGRAGVTGTVVADAILGRPHAFHSAVETK